MARNAFGVISGGPRGNLSQADLDYLYGRDGAFNGGEPGPVTYGGPVPDLTPRPSLRGSIDETAPTLRGTLGPTDSMGGRNTQPQGPTRGGIPTASGAPLPVGKGFAQAVYERALGAGLTDTQARLVASQAALESNHGRSGLSRDANNFFGIKAPRGGDYVSMRTREENAGGGSYYETARFRKYATPEDSFKDHLALLQRKYPDALSANNIDAATAGLRYGQQGGYATDQRYGAKIASIARGLKPPGDLDNPTGIRPPRDIPNPMGAGPVDQPVNNMATGANFSPQSQQNYQTHDLVDRHQLTGSPQSYIQTLPYTPQPAQRVQDYFQPIQVQQPQQFQPVQTSQNAFGGGDNDLVSFLGLGGDMGGWG